MMCVIELFGVEWVGDQEPVLFQLAPLLGSVFVAAAAAYAARLAARTANRRQREQLEHDAGRQREQLEHDTERQREELAHDREMRKQDYVRDAIDRAVELVSEVHDAIATTEGAARWLEGHRASQKAILADKGATADQKREAAKDLVESQADFRKTRIEADGKVLEMYASLVRLALRLGADHEIPGRYEKLIDAWGEIIKSLEPVPDRDRDSDELAASEAASERGSERYAELMVDCEAWLHQDD